MHGYSHADCTVCMHISVQTHVLDGSFYRMSVGLYEHFIVCFLGCQIRLALPTYLSGGCEMLMLIIMYRRASKLLASHSPRAPSCGQSMRKHHAFDDCIPFFVFNSEISFLFGLLF